MDHYDLQDAEADGTLASVASTYSPDNDRIYDGMSRPGPRVVTFTPILKHGRFPLAEVIGTLMETGARGMGVPVGLKARTKAGQPQWRGFRGRGISFSLHLIR